MMFLFHQIVLKQARNGKSTIFFFQKFKNLIHSTPSTTPTLTQTTITKFDSNNFFYNFTNNFNDHTHSTSNFFLHSFIKQPTSFNTLRQLSAPINCNHSLCQFRFSLFFHECNYVFELENDHILRRISGII